MTIEPPDYSPGLIHRLRMPEVDGQAGAWRSSWVLRTVRPPASHDLKEAARRVAERCGCEVDLRLSDHADDDRTMSLTLGSAVHPFAPEAYPLVDCVLRTLDADIGPLAEINDSPRDLWRTFRG
jgi:hypothetical protein